MFSFLRSPTMKKLIAPALLSLMAMSGYAFAQSATETQSETPGAGGRNAASDASGTTRQPGASTPGQRNANGAQAGTTARAQSSNAGGQAAQGGMIDQHIAVCLLLGNQEEVALGQFAQDRAQHPEVKQFAQMMAQEHQEAI